jgi:hypothetical protein
MTDASQIYLLQFKSEFLIYFTHSSSQNKERYTISSLCIDRMIFIQGKKKLASLLDVQKKIILCRHKSVIFFKSFRLRLILE